MKNLELYRKVYDRAKKLNIVHPNDKLQDVMMDLESADVTFNMDWERMLQADDFNFAHDFCGISNNIVRDEFPSKNFRFFVPRFARGGK